MNIADMVMRLVAAGAGPIEAACVVAEAFALGAATLSVTLPPALPATRSRKATNQANYRARKLEKSGESVALAANPDPVTPPATSGNSVTGNVTTAPLTILTSLSPGEPTEVKKERGVDVLNTEPRVKAKRQRGNGTRTTEDWEPDAKGMKYAADRGLRLVEIEIEITKFRNYWINRTDRDSWKPRWDLAWQNWILNAKGMNNAGANGHRANSNPGPPQTHGDAVMAGMARFAEKRRNGQSTDPRNGFCGRDDAAGEPVAHAGATNGNREPSRQLALVPVRNTGK